MKDGTYNKIITFIFIILVICCLNISGCIENNQNNNSSNNKNNIILIEHFIGTWSGIQEQNQIPLNVTFYENKTGYFQEIKITWDFNETQLELGMYEGESPSYYSYTFSNSNQTLLLENRYINETFTLTKKTFES